MSKKINLRWARKIMKSRNFVIMTDTESVIFLDGIDPNSMDNLVMLAAQASSLDDFIARLKEVAKHHEARATEITGKTGITKGESIAKQATTTRSKNVPKKQAEKGKHTL